MYFSVADLEVSPLIPPLVAFVISFFTSMGGVSGAFLLLPFQISVLGFCTPAVSSTNQLYNIVAIPSGVYRYIKEGRMVWPLAWIVILGTLPGVFIGGLVRVRYLPDATNFKMFAGLVLLYIGVRLLSDLLGKQKSGNGQQLAEQEFQKLVRSFQSSGERDQLPVVVTRKLTATRLVYEFYGQEFQVNTLWVTTLTFFVGIVGGIYGIGGGSIIAPYFVSFLGLPVYTVAGAALLGTFVTAVVGVLFYVIIAPYYPELVITPDWMLGLLFGAGGFLGMYCGARMQKFVPANAIKWVLAGCLLFTATKYIVEFFI